MQLAIVAVYYNEMIEGSETWRTLLSAANKREDIRIIFADNSTDADCKEKNRAFAGWNRCRYIDMQGNRGLPAAYNAAIECLQEEQEQAAEWIITADQDTTFPENYLQSVINAAEQVKAAEKQSSIKLLAPVVKSKAFLLSPCAKEGARFTCCNEEKTAEARPQELFFINSGLCIRADVFLEHGIRYNPSLFLDFADFDLENQIRHAFPDSARILSGVVLQQHFSGTEKKRSAAQDLERYRQYVKDGEVFYQTWEKGNRAYKKVLLGRGIKLAIRHKDLRFLTKK